MEFENSAFFPAARSDLYGGIREVLLASRLRTRQAVTTAMVQADWEIGRLIVEGEQGGKERAAYGKRVLPELAQRLKSPEARAWYADEAAREAWGVRAQGRQIGTLFYERRLLSQDKTAVPQEARASIAAEAPAELERDRARLEAAQTNKED